MPFCEGLYGGLFRGRLLERGHHLPEYGNCITALVITWAGAHMLFFWDSDSVFLRVICAAFAANGVASFAFHAVGSCGKADLDTMCVAAVLTFAYSTEELVRHFSLGLPPRHARLCRRLATAAIWMSVTTFFWLFVANRDLWEPQRGYVAGVVVPSSTFGVASSCSAIAGGLIGHMGWLSPECVPSETLEQILRRFRLGVFLCLIAYGMQLFSEAGCEHFDLAKWFPGHAVWHVLVSLGLVNVLLLLSAMRADNTRRRLVLLSPRTHGRYFAVLPAVRLLEAAPPLIERQEATLPCPEWELAAAEPSQCPAKVLGAGQAEGDLATILPGQVTKEAEGGGAA